MSININSTKEYFIQIIKWAWESFLILLWEFLVQIPDKGANVILAPLLNWLMKPVYPFGYHKDTLSEVFGRNVDNCRFCYWFCLMASKFDERHCEKNIIDD